MKGQGCVTLSPGGTIAGKLCEKHTIQIVRDRTRLAEYRHWILSRLGQVDSTRCVPHMEFCTDTR